MQPPAPHDDPRHVNVHARPDDLDPRFRFGMQSRWRQRRLWRAVLLWAVAVLFLFLFALVMATW